MSSTVVVLTDVADGVYEDCISVSPSGQLELSGSDGWSISKRTLRGGLSDGVDVVDVNNGALAVQVIPTRGMGIWRAEYQGIHVGWQSPVTAPVHPSFINLMDRGGLGWLAGFNELLCRCGLAWIGPPGTDVVTALDGSVLSETFLTLHGRIANLPAHHVEIEISTDGPGRLALTGVVDESSLFGPSLRLTSRLQTEAGSNSFRIIDEVTNRSAQAAEAALLYHTNVGSPILEAGAQFLAPVSGLAPRDAHAANDLAEWTRYRGPKSGYTEQCYFVEPLADENGRSLVLLHNAAGDAGISLRFARDQLPCFTLWKNTQAAADGYVTGLEPGTCFPNFRVFERQQGRLVTLEPGASLRAELEISVHNSADSVADAVQQIHSIQADHAPTVHSRPAPPYCSAG